MKRFILGITIAASLLSGATVGAKSLGVEVFVSVDELANEITSYFPKIQGEVTSVQGDRVTVSLGKKDGLVPGVELSLWRAGKEIHHPVTGAVIGHLEDAVGTAEAADVSDTTSTAVITKRVTAPRPGDKARITPKKITLAVLPLRADRPELIKGLIDRLNDSGRFAVVDNDKVAAFLKDKKQRDTSLIKEMDAALHPDVIAAVGIYPMEGEKLLVTTRMFYADEARPIDAIMAVLDLSLKKTPVADIKPFFAPASVDQSSTPELPLNARFFVTADLQGTGTPQYIFSDGSRVHIYKRDTSGWSETWAEPVPSDVGGVQQINLDAADINGSGRPELFVTVMQNEKVFSYVIGFQDGAYQRIAEVPGFLRVLSVPGRGNILIGQDYDPKTFYAGLPKQYIWSGGKYVPGTAFPLPAGVSLYGFAYASVGESSPLLVALNAEDYVVVYSQDIPIWKSAERYPAVGTVVAKPVTGVDATLDRSAVEGDKSLKVRITGRVTAIDMNGDGRDEIILPKNSGGSLLSGYTQGEIISLGWTGARFEERWTIKDVPGVVVDYQVVKQQGAATQILALVNSPGGLFKSDHIRVTAFTAK